MEIELQHWPLDPSIFKIDKIMILIMLKMMVTTIAVFDISVYEFSFKIGVSFWK